MRSKGDAVRVFRRFLALTGVAVIVGASVASVASAHVYPLKRARADALWSAREWAKMGESYGMWKVRGWGVRSCKWNNAHKVTCRVYTILAVTLLEEDTGIRLGWRVYTCAGTVSGRGYTRTGSGSFNEPPLCPYKDELFKGRER
jgi:hypothetical protein